MSAGRGTARFDDVCFWPKANSVFETNSVRS